MKNFWFLDNILEWEFWRIFFFFKNMTMEFLFVGNPGNQGFPLHKCDNAQRGLILPTVYSRNVDVRLKLFRVLTSIKYFENFASNCVNTQVLLHSLRPGILRWEWMWTHECDVKICTNRNFQSISEKTKGTCTPWPPKTREFHRIVPPSFLPTLCRVQRGQDEFLEFLTRTRSVPCAM